MFSNIIEDTLESVANDDLIFKYRHSLAFKQVML